MRQDVGFRVHGERERDIYIYIHIYIYTGGWKRTWGLVLSLVFGSKVKGYHPPVAEDQMENVLETENI